MGRSKSFAEDNVLLNGAIEEMLDLVAVGGEGKDPHQLGGNRFDGHIVGFDEVEASLHHVTYLVNGHVAALVGNLGGHDDSVYHKMV